MSKYRYWWRPAVVRCIQYYGDLKAHSAVLAPGERKILEAIDNAQRDAQELRRGDEILAVSEAILFRGRYTVDQYAGNHFISRRTVTRMISKFIDLVAARMGLLPPAGEAVADPEELQP